MRAHTCRATQRTTVDFGLAGKWVLVKSDKKELIIKLENKLS